MVTINLTEMRRFEIKILGFTATKFNRDAPGTFKLENSVIIQPSKEDKMRGQGVVIVTENMQNVGQVHLILLMSVTFDTMDGPFTIFQLFAPDSSYKDNIYKELYDPI